MLAGLASRDAALGEPKLLYLGARQREIPDQLRPGDPNPRSRASSCAENTSRVATDHHHHLSADDRRHDSPLTP